MTQSLNTLKRRLRGIESTHKITRAMEMVASVKLSRVRDALHSSRPYFFKLEAILNDLLANAGKISHPLLEKRTPSSKGAALCVIASDTGLCGTYNQAVIDVAEDFINRFDKGEIKLITVGKEAHTHFKKPGREIINSYAELHGKYSDEIAGKILNDLVGVFLAKEADEIYVAYMRFGSTLRHHPQVEKFLNIEYTGNAGINYIIEPGIDELVEKIIPRYISEKFRSIFLSALTSEHSARMVAMKTATDNAEDLIDALMLQRNKARQAQITKEVIEIASGVEALRG